MLVNVTEMSVNCKQTSIPMCFNNNNNYYHYCISKVPHVKATEVLKATEMLSYLACN